MREKTAVYILDGGSWTQAQAFNNIPFEEALGAALEYSRRENHLLFARIRFTDLPEPFLEEVLIYDGQFFVPRPNYLERLIGIAETLEKN